MGKISVVVPTYNEAENVGNLVNQIDYALRGIEYEVIFVDDSTDDTPEAIRKVMISLLRSVMGLNRFFFIIVN